MVVGLLFEGCEWSVVDCVFDVCVVFGGKIVYLLECVELNLLVLDVDVCCCVCIYDNLCCLGLSVEV